MKRNKKQILNEFDTAVAKYSNPKEEILSNDEADFFEIKGLLRERVIAFNKEVSSIIISNGLDRKNIEGHLWALWSNVEPPPNFNRVHTPSVKDPFNTFLISMSGIFSKKIQYRLLKKKIWNVYTKEAKDTVIEIINNG